MLHIKSGNSKRQNVAIYVTDSINELNRLDQIDLHPSDKHIVKTEYMKIL